MSDLADMTTELLKELEEMGLEGETVPEEITSLTSDSTEEEKKKADHAFKQFREKLRVAKGVIQQQSEELRRANERQVEQTSRPAPQPSNADLNQQSAYYLATLQTRAMEKIGTPDVNSPLVQLEIQRLYAHDMEIAEKKLTADKDAEAVLEQTFSEFPQLGDDDKREIVERLSTQDVLARTDSDFVKSAVHTYMGANFEKFSKAPSEPKAKSSKSAASSGAAAVSNVKARGSGVEPGTDTSSGGAEGKPATPEELKEMRAIGIPPDDLHLYRKAKIKKDKYTQ